MNEILLIPVAFVFMLAVGLLLIVRRVSRREYHSREHFDLGELLHKKHPSSEIDIALDDLRERYEKAKSDERLAKVFNELREIMGDE